MTGYELHFNDSRMRKSNMKPVAASSRLFLLEDLTPGTTYHLRLVAKSMNGENSSTPTIQVTTPNYGEQE